MSMTTSMSRLRLCLFPPSTTAPNFVTTRLNAAKLDYAQRVNEVTMMPSFSPSPAPPFCGHQPAFLSNEKDDLSSTSSFYGLAFTEDLCSFHSRQTGPDLIKYIPHRSFYFVALRLRYHLRRSAVSLVILTRLIVARIRKIFILPGADKPPEANTKKNVRETRTGGKAPHERKRETHGENSFNDGTVSRS